MTLQMHDAPQENVWLVVNIVLWVYGEFVIAQLLSWCRFNHSKQATMSPPEKKVTFSKFARNDPPNA